MKLIKGAAIFFFGLVGEWIFSRYLSFHGLNPQILLILTIGVAAFNGTPEAMVFGFFWGLCWDALSLNLFGARALALTLVAYGLGLVRRQVDMVTPGAQAIVAVIATVLYRMLLGFIYLIFSGQFLWLGWTIFLLEPVYNGIFCFILAILRPNSYFSSSRRGSILS